MFRLINYDGRSCLEENGFRFDLARLSRDPDLCDPMNAIARHRELHHWTEQLNSVTPDGVVDVRLLRAPSPRPQKVFGIGVNYVSHANETGRALPQAPLTFAKFPSCLTGPASHIILSGKNVDWEVELVVVIGDQCKKVSIDNAWKYVAGLTLGQDISDRDLQNTGQPSQFCLAKSFDTYGPCGPAIVSVDTFNDPDDVEIWCDVSGQRMQHAFTRDLIFSVPKLIAYLSSICTLFAGDLIFTGTPEGVGRSRGRYLREGDEIISGANQIGLMTNRCVRDS